MSHLTHIKFRSISILRVDILGVFSPISRQLVKFTYPIDSSKKCTFAWKRRRLFYASKVFQTAHAFGWPYVKLFQNSEKLKMLTPNRNIEASCRISGDSLQTHDICHNNLTVTHERPYFNSAERKFWVQFCLFVCLFFNLKSGLSTPRQKWMVADWLQAAKIAQTMKLSPFW